MPVFMKPDEEIRLINKFFADYGIKASINREASVPIPGAYMSYAISLHPGATISSIEGKIRELSERLSMARMAPTPIRLREMPLGLEVPSANPQPLRPTKEAVGLEPYEMLLGQMVGYGGVQDLTIDLRQAEHLLVAGTTGSGKSSLVNVMLSTLLWNTSPKQVGIVPIDLKNDDLRPFEHAPHTLASAFSLHQALAVVDALHNLKDSRVHQGPRTDYQQIFVLVDEWAEWCKEADTMNMMASIMSVGRSLGIHVLAATQLPLVSVVGSIGKGQLTNRLVGRVMSSTDSNTASGLNGLGAHYLPGNGSFIMVAGGGVQRFQSYYLGKVTPDAVAALRHRWQGHQAAGLLVDQKTEQLSLWQNAQVVEADKFVI